MLGRQYGLLAKLRAPVFQLREKGLKLVNFGGRDLDALKGETIPVSKKRQEGVG